MSAMAMADREAEMTQIIDLLSHYAWCLDKTQVETMRDVFAEKAEALVKVAGNGATEQWYGRDRVVDGLIGMRESRSQWRSQQLTTPLFTALSDTRATVRTYLSLFTCDRGQAPEIAATGEYRANVSRAEGRWAIDRLELILDCDIAV